MIYVFLFDVFLAIILAVGVIAYIRDRKGERREDEEAEKRYADHMHG